MSDEEKRAEATAVNETEAQRSHIRPPCPGGFHYTVQSGDTMFSIARRFGISLNDLIAANPQVRDPNLIFPGQVLCIPAQAPVTCPNGFIYVVRPGDTLSGIASMFGTTVDRIMAANPHIKDPNLIFPGQRLCIPLTLTTMPRRHCFIMHPTHHCSGAMGMGMIDIEKRELLVIARGLPDPRHYGKDRVVLMVRYREMEEFKTVEMMPMFHDMMMCHHMIEDKMDRDPVFLIGAAAGFPFAFGPLFLGAIVPIII